MENGVTEPDHSTHYIIAYLLGAKTVSWNFYGACFTLADMMPEYTPSHLIASLPVLTCHFFV